MSVSKVFITALCVASLGATAHATPEGDKARADVKAALGFIPGFLKMVPDSALPGAWAEMSGFQMNPKTLLSGKANTWVLFPSAPLEPRGRYALVITRRALLADGRALGPSQYMTGQLASAGSPAAEALASLAGATPPVGAEDVALLLSVSVRTTDTIGDDLLAIRAAIRLAGPPEFTIETVDDDGDDSAVGAIIHGTWIAPSFRDGDFVARDADGAPRRNGETPLPFVLALPRGALERPAPIIIYQHGSPGSAEREVAWAARGELAAAGFAVLGFTNIRNRELIRDGDVSPATLATFVSLLQNHRFPDYLAKLDTAEHQGVGLLAFAPEIHAVALVVGGGRWSASVVHQESQGPNPTQLYQVVTNVFPSITRHELWVGIALSPRLGSTRRTG